MVAAQAPVALTLVDAVGATYLHVDSVTPRIVHYTPLEFAGAGWAGGVVGGGEGVAPRSFLLRHVPARRLCHAADRALHAARVCG